MMVFQCVFLLFLHRDQEGSPTAQVKEVVLMRNKMSRVRLHTYACETS